MKIDWAKYLKENPECHSIVDNQEYITAWDDYFKKIKKVFHQMN